MLQACNWTKNEEKQANNARRTTGKLSSEIRFVFRSKTFPMKDSLMQKCSNVEDNSDITKQCVSVPFLPLKCVVIMEMIL